MNINKKLQWCFGCCQKNKSLLMLLVFFVSMLGIKAESHISWAYRIHSEIKNFQITLDGIRYPRAFFQNLKNELMQSKSEMQRPLFRDIVGYSKVGYFGYMPAPMVYNDFNYHPSPVPISFAAWNEGLMKANSRYYSAPKSAPDFLIVSLATIDGRLVAQDDALSQMEILHRYTPIEAENGEILLRRKSEEVDELQWSLLSKKRNYHLGEKVLVPDRNVPIWVKIRMRKTWISSLLSLIYKPESYSINLKLSDGQSVIRKFIPSMASVGFMISPLILDNDALLQVLTESPHISHLRVEEFTISCERLGVACQNSLGVEFESIENL